jgi:hypothetical protein
VRPLLRQLFSLHPLDVPDDTPGVYFTLLPSGEVKIGSTVDLTDRMRAGPLRGNRLLAVLPGGRGVEADLHARFRPLRSRQDGPGHREIYAPDDELVALITDIRDRGFTVEQLRAGLHKPSRTPLPFNDGQTFQLELTHLHFVEKGTFVPRHILQARCPGCQELVSSGAFVRHWTAELIATKVYLVLRSGRLCAGCDPVPALPAGLGFPKGVTSIRLRDLRVGEAGELAEEGYDRDHDRWRPLRDFGVRRMAKRADDPEHDRLRLQPYTQRKGRAQNAGGKQLRLGIDDRGRGR